MPKCRDWTDEELADIRQRRLCHFTNAEIAQRYGVSPWTIARLVSSRNLLTREKVYEINADRMRGRKHTAAALKKMSQRSRAAWDRPDYREAGIAHLHSFIDDEKRKTNLRRRQDEERGFHFSDEKQPEYRRLVDVKKLPPAQAGAILGLVGEGA